MIQKNQLEMLPQDDEKMCLNMFRNKDEERWPDYDYIRKKRSYIWNTIKNNIDSIDSFRKIPMDNKYYMADRDTVKGWVEEEKTNTKDYVMARFDCENFAMMFMSKMADNFGTNQIGVVVDYSSAHGYNIIVYPDDTVELFEPQEDKYFKYKERDKDMYNMDYGYIII